MTLIRNALKRIVLLRHIKNFFTEINRYKSISPPVIYSWKYFFRWRKTLDKNKSPLDYQLPWLTYNAIGFLNKELKPGMQIFEFGGGGSTLYFLNKNCIVHTVEHDIKWFEILKKNIDTQPYRTKWKGYHIAPEVGVFVENAYASDPLHYISLNKNFNGYNFKKYATKVAEYENNFFDIVLIDGRARPSCIFESLKKVKKGKFLIVDNTERNYYAQKTTKLLEQYYTLVLDAYGPVTYSTIFSQTTIWKRK